MIARDEEGFLLMEALVAFVILSLVIVSVYDALTLSYQSRRLVAEKDEALATARSLFALAGASGRLPEPSRGTTTAGAAWQIVALPSRNPEGPGSKKQAARQLRYTARRLDGSLVLDLECVVLLSRR